MKGTDSRPTTHPLRIAVILLGVATLLVATLAALVCYKTGLQPAELGWFDDGKPSTLVLAILREAHHEVLALCLAALNFAWLLVRLHAIEPVSADASAVGASDARASDSVASGESEANAAADDRLSPEPSRERATAVATASGSRPGGVTPAVRAAENADAQLRIAAGELSRLRTELATCRHQLDTANTARSQFLANVSHELRTPMNGIIGMTDLLLGGELPPRERRFVQSIAVSSNALLGIISDLLDFSGIESGTLSLERSRFRIRDAVEDVCAMLAGRAHEKGIELMCYVDDNVPVLADGDASRLRQVLDNVIRNAIAFTSQGEVVVRVSRVEERGARSLYRCDVQDTGSGISPEMQMTMFDAFTQEDSSSTRRHGGLGIGLAIVRELVTLMGGSITFRSRLGKGTRFGFTVELENAEGDAEENRTRTIRGARVLVVDDNETNRTILYHQLSGWGVLADTAESGEAALGLLHEMTERGEPYDLLVLDLHMPDMDGLELARRIRDEPAFGAIRSLMLTSAALELDDEELRALGIDRYVSKPPRQSVLHESLVSLLPSGMSTMRGRRASAAVAANVSVGARVLLAEDNIVSQDVGVGLLESVGCRVDVAVDGQEVLKRTRAEVYDLILMDCRMPGIDGYAATATIRAGNGPNATTPIVALTASAMQGDRERCLEVGMDDYLAKPVRRDDLNALLVRWITSGEAEGGTVDAAGVAARAVDGAGEPAVLAGAGSTDGVSAEGVSAEAAGVPAAGVPADEVPTPADEDDLPPRLDEVALEEIRQLQRPGKPDLLSKVLRTYVERTPPTLEAMRAALEAEDEAALVEQVHTLRSSSAYVGAARLAEQCSRLERAVESGDRDAVATFVARIDEEFAVVSAELGALSRAA